MKKNARKLYGFREWAEELMKDPKFRKSLEEPDEDPYLDVAFRLVNLREETGWTQADLGRKLGVSQQAVARLENPSYRGHSLKSLHKIAKAYGRLLKISFITPTEAGSGNGNSRRSERTSGSS